MPMDANEPLTFNSYFIDEILYKINEVTHKLAENENVQEEIIALLKLYNQIVDKKIKASNWLNKRKDVGI
jgi:hypothetical protein